MRLKADIRISIKNNVTGKSFKLELIKVPTNSKRFWARFNGVNSEKSPEVSLTQLCNRLRKLLKIIVKELYETAVQLFPNIYPASKELFEIINYMIKQFF